MGEGEQHIYTLKRNNSNKNNLYEQDTHYSISQGFSYQGSKNGTLINCICTSNFI